MISAIADDDHERGQRTERVDVVRRAELPAADQRLAESESLDERGRHGEADEREPGDPGQDEPGPQDRERRIDQETDEIRGPGSDVGL